VCSQFNDDWTPVHLTGGRANLYQEMDLALKGEEWRQPGLVALATKLATSAGAHTPFTVRVPTSYEPKTGANPWASAGPQPARSQVLPASADAQANVPHSRPPPVPSADEVASTSTGLPVQRTPVDIHPNSAKPLPVPWPSQERRRDEDVRDEMRFFGSCGSRDHPPTQRTLNRGKQVRHSTTLGAQESERASVVGRARADSLAEEPSACWLAIRPSSSAPGASEPGGARDSGVGLSA
jgi:hypothetical protein